MTEPTALRERAAQAVQANCDIADARHAADLTLCTYLLQMREFYRWQQGLALGVPLARAAVGAWIAEREQRWQAIEASDFAPLVFGANGTNDANDVALDPFDTDAVNARLRPQGLLYGAGLVGRRPVFFLAELHAAGQREGLGAWAAESGARSLPPTFLDVLQAGTELARTLLAPPAVLAGGDRGPIVLRRQSLARWCWERVEAFALRPAPASALGAMVQSYGLAQDFHAALPRWLDDQVETAVLHELGEHRAGQWLGPDWSALRAALLAGAAGPAELQARALRDHLADLTVTLPALLERGAAAPLHAWFAGYDGLRLALFPALPAAYAAWRGGDAGRQLSTAIAAGRRHFEALALELLALWRREGQAGAGRIAERLKSSLMVCEVQGRA